MLLLSNTVRDYAWGSYTAIPDLLGTEVTESPQAELWIGAHPDSPSATATGDTLDHVIAADPRTHLGAVGQRFQTLPYLLKVLAAAAPLSLQVHPTEEQARRGYEAEEAAGVPHDAPHRRYKDPHHKPEMVVALTDFHALCGLRTASAAQQVMAGLDVDHPGWHSLVALLDRPSGLQEVFEKVLREPDPSLVDAVVAACAARRDDGSAHDLEDETVVELGAAYPGDPGVLLSLLVNRVVLAPGEALYLPAGNVHAYLHGTALEIMASSDNVLRAGLTPKYVDVDELLAVVDFSSLPVPYVEASPVDGVTSYRPAAAEFALDLVTLDGASGKSRLPASGPRVLLALEGAVDLRCASSGDSMTLHRGESVYLADSDGPISLMGEGSVAIGSVPSMSAAR